MAFTDNVTRNAQPTNVGFKISKPGYNAVTTSGQNLIFNSSWPSLPIAFQTTIPNPGGGAFTVAHNLGFAPLIFIWAYGPDASGVGNTAYRVQAFQTIDTINVYLDSSSFPGATYINIKCFQLDLSRDIDYILGLGDTFNFGYDPNFGIKLVKPNKSINSKDMRDFALHSRCQSPLIFAVKTQDTMSPFNTKTIQYTTKVKYPVWVYGYIRKSDGSYKYSPFTGVSPENTTTNGVVTHITWSGTDTGATVVILRDPLFAPTSTTVQY